MEVDREEVLRRVERLERTLRVHRVLAAAFLALLAVAAAPPACSARPAAPDLGVLRARGLVIEDDKGRERILLGAPVPETAGRKRKDATNALVFLDENGFDRVLVGRQPDPQAKGQVVPRRSPAHGINVYDAAGNERGGFSFLESGAVVLGLDNADGREGVSVSVDDAAGYSAIMMAGRLGEEERLGLFVDDGASVLKVADTTGSERLILLATDEAEPKFLLLGPRHSSEVDLLEKIRK